MLRSEEAAMKAIRVLAAFAFICAGTPAFAAGQDEDWSTFSHALTLVQQFVRIAASDDPGASLKAIDDLLAGRNGEANRAAAGLLEGVTADMPGEQRDQVASIGRDLVGIMRREARAPASSTSSLSGASVDRALQARKDLTAMGLRYYDAEQFNDAVKRNDKLAVDLFVAGNGIDPAVVARSLPAAR
jgi:hypothetical protein